MRNETQSSSRWVWIFLLLLAGLCFWQGFQVGGHAELPPTISASQDLKRTPIRDLRTGMRVIGNNPELADQIIEPLQIEYPEEWRNVRLEMIKADDSQLLITLLRPMEWLEFHEARIGSVVELDLAELGASGPAEVIAIHPCPDIEPGNRPLITGTFEHTAANVIDHSVESETKPIGTTDKHPFWSQDRQEFVEAGDLKIGEQLRLADGQTTRVTSITPRAGPETVYNLEISGEHVYHVANSGVLVHNTYPNRVVSGSTDDFAKGWDRIFARGKADPRKFTDYIFKEGATHGKDKVFRGLGYGKEHSDELVKIWQKQAGQKYARGDYKLGKADQYGQRIDIEIELPGIGDAAGKTSYLKSG